MAGTSFAHARLAVVVVLLFGFFTNPSLSAQVATGSIVGTVRDSSGEIVPGAQVTIREVNRNTTWIRPGIILQVTDRVRVDVALEVGTIKEATTVVASSPVVRTDSSEVGTVIEEMRSRSCR
jgi:hypothetical protein